MTFKRSDEMNFYEVLEVAANAGQHEIHAAYLRAKETYSPDSPALYTMFTPEEARELLKLIEEAYATLSTQARRHEYDLRLARGDSSKASHENVTPLKPLSSSATSHKASSMLAPTSAVVKPAGGGGGDEGAWLKPSRTLGPKKDDLPAGFARSKFSVYEVDAKMEQEMANVADVDGGFFQRVRLYKKVSLEQMSDSSRISKSYLSAVETNSFDALPAAVFVRGFVTQMCRLLGIDEKRIVDAYMKFYKSQCEKK